MKNEKSKKAIWLVIAIVLFGISVLLIYLSSVYNRNNAYSYTENSGVSYTVCLKKNEDYKEKCLSDEMEYLSVLTDEVRVNFSYNTIYTKKIQGDYTYYVKGILKIFNSDNNKMLYTKEEILAPEKSISVDGEVLSIGQDAVIVFDNFNNLVNKYKSRYALSSNATLDVGLYVKDGSNEKKVSSVVIPLSNQTYSILKDEIGANTITIADTKNNIYGMASIATSVLAVLCVLAFIYELMNKNGTNQYEMEVNRILSEYDRIIVESTESSINYEGKNIIEASSFLELVDVRDTVEKPIIHIKKNEKSCEFLVQDESTIYRYAMNEKDYDDLGGNE